MNRVFFIVLTTMLISSASMAAGADRSIGWSAGDAASTYQDGTGGSGSADWLSEQVEFEIEDTWSEATPIAGSLDPDASDVETNGRADVAPLFGAYNVFRTSNRRDGESYVAFGLDLDELTGEQTGNGYDPDDGELSIGFGVNDATFNIEYMMYMDQGAQQISGISLGFVKAF